MKPPTVHIVILNWNGLSDTLQCLESLQKIEQKNFQIVVVDNASNSDAGQLSKLDSIKFIGLSENLGFSGGNNVGIRYAIENGAEYIMLLNNDTVVKPDFLSILIDSSVKKKAMVLTPLINYFDDKDQIWYAGGFISKLRGSAVSLTKRDNHKKNTVEEFVEFASGCCMLFHKDVIKKVGYWDENYFLYLEDADFSKRCRDAGFKILLNPSSQIYHKVNASTSSGNSSIPLYYMTRNRLYFTQKFFPKYLSLVKIYLLITMFGKSIWWVLNRRKENLKIVLKAFSDFDKNKMGKGKF